MDTTIVPGALAIAALIVLVILRPKALLRIFFGDKESARRYRERKLERRLRDLERD